MPDDVPSDLPTLSGSLLLANPALRDPNFSRSVIFMAAHNTEDGAFGYILNKPLHKSVADLLPDQNLGGLGEIPVFLGGPVATDKLAFASLRWSARKHSLACVTHLSVEDAMHELSLGRDVRGFVGYSGWTGGQLESELEKNSWIITPPKRVVLTSEEPTGLWSEILSGMGPRFQLIARMPEDVGLN